MKPLSQSRFALGSFQYIRYPFEYFLDTAVRLGYENTELWAAAPHLYPDALDASARTRIKGELKSRGLRAYCITPESVVYPFNIASKDETLRRLGITYFKACLDLAADLEAPNMLVTPGCGYFNEPQEEAWKRSLASMQEIAGYAEKRGIFLFYETLTPLSSNILNTPQQLAEMFAELPDNVGGIADFGQIAYMKQKLSDYMEILGKRLAHVHIHDSGPAIHMALGEGALPVTEQIAYLEAHGYSGLYSFEINDIRYRKDPAASDEKSLAWLREQGVMNKGEL
jgi:protein FrlC